MNIVNRTFLITLMTFTSCSCKTPNTAITLPIMVPTPGAMPTATASTPVQVKISANIAIVQLEGEINDTSFGRIKAALDRLENVNTVTDIIIEINSEGGEYQAGLNITKAIERSSKSVHCLVDGTAASMGYFILQGCDVRVMTKRSMLMIHQPLLIIEKSAGNVSYYQKRVDRLAALTASMNHHQSQKLLISMEELSKKIDDGREWWLAYDEALSIGAVDFGVDSLSELIASITSANNALDGGSK